jgi:hypothetical protein
MGQPVGVGDALGSGAAVQTLLSTGWVVGPVLETDRWRSELKAGARAAGVRVVTGITSNGRPWAARSDLADDEMWSLRAPWYLMGIEPRSFFSTYPPPIS